jgi:hypothetical protein
MEAAIGCIGIPINYNPQTTSYVRFQASNTAGAYSSKHTNVAGFVYLDGSVRFLPNSTSDTVRLALGTMAGGEAVNAP